MGRGKGQSLEEAELGAVPSETWAQEIDHRFSTRWGRTGVVAGAGRRDPEYRKRIRTGGQRGKVRRKSLGNRGR